MGNCWVRISCSAQLFLLNHYNCITRIFLNFLYAIDVVAYTVNGPINFLTRRGKIYGPNYAALGRIIIGEYSKCVELINSPQQRGHYLGRAKLMPSRVADNFPLFLSDSEAGGGTLHSTIHEYVWNTIIPPAFERLSSAEEKHIFDGYIAKAVQDLRSLGPNANNTKAQKEIVRHLTIQYVYHSIFGNPLTPDQIEGMKSLFFGKKPGVDYVASALSPYAMLCCMCCMGSRNRNVNQFIDLISNSPALQNYVPSNETGNLSKENYAEILLAIVGVAGCVGTSLLCAQVINAIPSDYNKIDLNNRMDVTRAVLEAGRIKAPVNNVNIILQNKLIVTMKNGRAKYTFRRGTPVAASIGLSSVDENEFENPNVYNHERENLIKSVINFNHVGYSAEGSGRRQCPGRNIAIKLASDLLVAVRTGDQFEDQNV